MTGWLFSIKTFIFVAMEEQFDIRKQQSGAGERDFENALRPLRFEDSSGQLKAV